MAFYNDGASYSCLEVRVCLEVRAYARLEARVLASLPNMQGTT